jgi:hypothetical protein
LFLDDEADLSHDVFATGSKIRTLFHDDLQVAKVHGTCGRHLYRFSLVLRIHLIMDTQSVEGINSLIRVNCTRCRRIGLPLLSARTQMKKALSLGTRNAATKWSEVRPIAESILNRCHQQHDQAANVLADNDRWDTAPLYPLTGALGAAPPLPLPAASAASAAASAAAAAAAATSSTAATPAPAIQAESPAVLCTSGGVSDIVGSSSSTGSSSSSSSNSSSNSTSSSSSGVGVGNRDANDIGTSSTQPPGPGSGHADGLQAATKSKATHDQKWAVGFSWLLNRLVNKEISVAQCVTSTTHPGTAWLCVEKSYSLMTMMKCTVFDGDQLAIIVPLVSKSSVEALRVWKTLITEDSNFKLQCRKLSWNIRGHVSTPPPQHFHITATLDANEGSNLELTYAIPRAVYNQINAAHARLMSANHGSKRQKKNADDDDMTEMIGGDGDDVKAGDDNPPPHGDADDNEFDAFLQRHAYNELGDDDVEDVLAALASALDESHYGAADEADQAEPAQQCEVKRKGQDCTDLNDPPPPPNPEETDDDDAPVDVQGLDGVGLDEAQPSANPHDAVKANAGTLISQWCVQVAVGASVIRNRNEKVRSGILPDINGDLSLMELTRQVEGPSGSMTQQTAVVYVQWGHRHNMRGRIARLDDHNRVIYSIPGYEPEYDFTNEILVHPALGVQMKKVRGDKRPSIPYDHLHLHRMWQAAITSQTLDKRTICNSTSLDACEYCHTHGPIEGRGVHHCALCLTSHHKSCAEVVAGHLQPNHARASKLNAGDLPMRFNCQRAADDECNGVEVDPLCDICRKWIGV